MRDHLSFSSAARATARLLLAGSAVFALAATTAEGQRRTEKVPAIQAVDGVPDLEIKPARSFSLFANTDLAATGMKNVAQFGTGISNMGGPCADGFVLFQCNNILLNGFWQFTLFELTFIGGAPPSQRNKIAAVYPGVTASGGGGWTSVFNGPLLNVAGNWGPADNQLGVYFSGSTSTDDGSCRDNTHAINGYMTTGVSLLAGSTCPETWAASGFNGPRPIPGEEFVAEFNADQAGYGFEWWRIPESRHDQTKWLGDFATYGRTSDYYDDILKSFGTVTKAGADRGYNTSPSITGYPLGLDIEFDAFTFALPAIANAYMIQALVINNSERVYGAGIDYDSLYLGLEMGIGGSPQNHAHYFMPNLNAVLVTNNGVNTNCNGAITGGGVPGCTQSGARGFGDFGAQGFITLKSPIGDHRNKLFTDPSSAFYNPSNIHRGDTITINHGHKCGYGGCTLNTHFGHSGIEQSGFGMVSSTPTNVLAGRAPGAFDGTGASSWWLTFRNRDYPTRTARFNQYVPGNWDYNKDGIQDTLFLDSCDVDGCVVPWSDTLPGKQNNAYGNVGGTLTAGPFSLAAGDTTSFIWAFVGTPDSSSFELAVRSITSAYMSFWLTPTPPPVPRIASTAVREGATGSPQVAIFFTNDPEVWQDPFLLKTATDLEGSQLDELNPGLLDAIRDRAAANFTRLLVFKSCDDGDSFTDDADCVGDPAVDVSGAPIGAGWQAYSVIEASATGQIPNSFVDNNVIGGRTYLYSLVTESQGFSAPVRDINPQTGDTITRIYEAVEPLTSSLQRSGPSVAKVYVPISRPAGTSAASFTLNALAGTSTVPVNVLFNQDARGGTYRLVFGDRFIVTTTRDGTTGSLVNTTVTVQDILPRTIRGTTRSTSTVFNQVTFDAGANAVAVGGTISGTGSFFSGGNEVTVDTVASVGYVLVECENATSCSSAAPIFISTSLTTAGATPDAAFALSNFPNFRVTIDQPVGGTLTLERLVKANGDTVFTGIMNAGAIQYREQSGASVKTAAGNGSYEFLLRDEVFGPGSPFRINYSDPNATQTAVTNSLNSRAVGSTGSTSSAVQAILAAADPSWATATLMAVKFPFTLVETTGSTDTLILAMRARTSNSMRLGSGNDTLRVQVPADVWIPGDRFAALRIIQTDSMVADTVVLDETTGQPIQVTDTVVAFNPLVLGCNNPAESCNPVAIGSPGATGYLPTEAGWKLVLNYAIPFNARSEVAITVTPSTVMPVASLTSADTRGIRVVPNPYIFSSAFDEVGNQRIADPRLFFTGVPESGSMRIYSVSGQFLQELVWTAATLNGNGDLAYNLRTREGTDLTSGLYIFIIRSAGKVVHRGKFVVIR